MLTFCAIAIVVLGIALWDLNRRTLRALQIMEAEYSGLSSALFRRVEERQSEEAKLRAAIEQQEELVAMLWFAKYGMEPAEEGSYVPSGRLTEINGLRPHLRVGDPIGAGDDFFFDRDDE